eukprot:SM000329S12573  [mRNA]  locus=s329:79415:80429:- [translate_table: standard]
MEEGDSDRAVRSSSGAATASMEDASRSRGQHHQPTNHNRQQLEQPEPLPPPPQQDMESQPRPPRQSVDGASVAGNGGKQERGAPEFSYLEQLLASAWTGPQEACLHCVIVGVHEFQLRHEAPFRLVVSLNDGSRICRATVCSNVVERFLGQSLAEATVALAGPASAPVKAALHAFQAFLASFEGLVQVLRLQPEDGHSGMVGGGPVAEVDVVDMQQGIKGLDARKLLLRVLAAACDGSSMHAPAPVIERAASSVLIDLTQSP